MSYADGGEIAFLEEGAREAALRLLPKSVRLVERKARSAAASDAGLCEFEVVTGNAAYKKGEHFYLTQAQADEAYRRLH